MDTRIFTALAVLILSTIVSSATTPAPCPAMDGFLCKSRSGSYGVELCAENQQIRDLCPYTCGDCTAVGTLRQRCAADPVCYESPYGCYWTENLPPAQRAFQQVHCARYRNDRFFCASQGGGWGCNKCWIVGNLKFYCSYMCGYCRR